MNVTALSYLLFALIVWLVALPVHVPRHRQALLLAASYLFYASWGLDFLALLIASSVINFSWGQLLRKNPTGPRLLTGVGLNLLILAIFKYLPAERGIFASGPGNDIIAHLIVPVGISFWTFQALSYLFDVYREDDEEPRLLEFFLYLAFWPTVLSGPVTRVGQMIPQFRLVTRANWEDIGIGCRRIAIGLFMKVVIAQLLAYGIYPGEGVVDGFDNVTGGWSGLDVWTLAVGFGFQLFFDFAGYTNIVIGIARLFGYRLPENFHRPYLSTTPSMFWTRWHMSLSFWIRDYVFLPLATMWSSLVWRNLALVLSMVAFGFWHAAAWTFVLWGAYQGCLLVAHRQVQRIRRGWPGLRLAAPLETLLSWGITFALISLGWVFFRAHGLHQIVDMLKAVVDLPSYRQHILRPDYYLMTAAIVGGYFAWIGASSLVEQLPKKPVLRAASSLLTPVAYAAIVISIIVWSRQSSPFIYFQF